MVWKSLAGDFKDETERAIFRNELAALQVELRKYSRMLADIAEVEDLTDLEETEGAKWAAMVVISIYNLLNLF